MWHQAIPLSWELIPKKCTCLMLPAGKEYKFSRFTTPDMADINQKLLREIFYYLYNQRVNFSLLVQSCTPAESVIKIALIVNMLIVSRVIITPIEDTQSSPANQEGI